MDYLFLVVSLLAGVHAYTFAQWLRQNGNKAGAMGVFFLILLSLVLPIYQIIAEN